MIAVLPLARSRRTLAGAALLVTAVLMMSAVGKLVAAGTLALSYPFGLDYGEGIVWQQMVNIVGGVGYAPLGTFPAIVYHYPPVYHLAAAAVARLAGWDGLVAGRFVSLASALASIVLIARLTYAAIPREVDRRPALIAAALGGAAFVGSPTVQFWSTLMRVDLLACALTLAGLWWTAESLRGRARLPWAALAFALAVYTKQTAIFGPAAAFLALWVARPRSAWTFAVLCGSLGLAALALLAALTRGEFLHHVVLYNVNRLDLGRWVMLVRTAATQIVTLALAALAAASAGKRLRPLAWRPLRARIAVEPAEGVLLLALIYLVLRVATVPLILKSGSSDNYLIDLFAAAAVFVGLGINRLADAVLGRAEWPRAIVAALVLVGLPLQAYRLGVANQEVRNGATLAARADLAGRIRAATKPVIADEMVLLRRGGQPVLFEPAIAAELSHAGLYDQRGFARMIADRRFAFFITEDGPGEQFFAERYSPVTAAAIRRFYPVVEHDGDLTLRLPAR